MKDHIKEQLNEGDLSTWLKVHNFFPLVVTLISVIGLFYTLISKIDVMQTRILYNEAMLSDYKNRLDSLENKYTDLVIKVSENTGSVKGIMTPLKISSGSAERR